MMPENKPSSGAGERLCAACGMCCNGILFHGMHLQPSDSAHVLKKLGLRLKRKDGELLFLQPCNAHRNNCCVIYRDRPERCRLFSCRQLSAVTEGRVTEEAALGKVLEARHLSDRIRTLFSLLGDNRTTRAFATRYAGIFTPPLDPSHEAEALREELQTAMQELETLLTRDFRN